jgi:hypothetical protein
MVSQDDLDLFEHLSRTKLRDWLNAEIGKETKFLLLAVDIDQIRRAQARASAWQTMLSLMDASTKKR